MLWSRRGNGIPLTWGHTRLSETDFRLITQESPGFICGECQIGVATTNKEAIGFDILNVAACTWAVFESIGPFPETLQNVWGRIYSEWFPASGYEAAEGPEILWNESKDTNHPNYRSEIWIPVKKSSLP